MYRYTHHAFLFSIYVLLADMISTLSLTLPQPTSVMYDNHQRSLSLRVVPWKTNG